MSRIGERIASYKREHPEQNDLRPEILKDIKAFFLKYNKTLTRVKSTDQSQIRASEFRREQVLKEVPKIALMMTILHNIFDWQQFKGYLLSDQEIMKILSELQKEIKIAPESYKQFQFAIFEFLESRNITRRLITNSLQSKKRLVHEYFIDNKISPNLSDADIHELASKIRIEDGLLGVFCYIEKETFDRLIGHKYQEIYLGAFSSVSFSPHTKKKNKKKYQIPMAFEFQPKKQFESSTNNIYGSVRRHEEFHGISEFISKYLARRVSAEEKKIKEEKFIEKRDKLWDEFVKTQGDIGEENSDKQQAFIKCVDFIYYENYLKTTKDKLLRELASQLIEGHTKYVQQKQTEPFPFFDNFLHFYKDDRRVYKKTVFDAVDNFSINSANEEYKKIFSKRKEYWKELVIKEMDEITDLISEVIRSHFEYINILFRIISISNADNILKNINNFIILIEEEKEIQKKL